MQYIKSKRSSIRMGHPFCQREYLNSVWYFDETSNTEHFETWRWDAKHLLLTSMPKSQYTNGDWLSSAMTVIDIHKQPGCFFAPGTTDKRVTQYPRHHVTK